MQETKKEYGKKNGILAFHGYQSFAPGEVTPEVAHEIGMKFAEQMWGGSFEVVVATHLDTGCCHNHFVLNSVSFVDGKKYNNGSNSEPEDMKYNTKTQSQLIAMNWISEIDFPRGIADRRTNWETLCRTTSTGDLQDVVLDMVDKFMQGTGADYSNADLTAAAKEHSSTEEYVNKVIVQIKSLLSTYNGDITKLAYTASTRTSNPLVKRMIAEDIKQPVFNTACHLMTFYVIRCKTVG